MKKSPINRHSNKTEKISTIFDVSITVKFSYITFFFPVWGMLSAYT